MENKQIKIHVLHTGEVCVSPYLPFGGDNCSLIKATGLTTKKKDRLWLPVSAYYIEHPKGKLLVDCGWDRAMSPNGEYDTMAQIKSLGSPILYLVNQGRIGKGQAVNEQLNAMGVKTSDIDYVLLTHLDCDHANGLPLVSDAKHILVANDEIACASKHSVTRYKKKWWKDVKLSGFDWNDDKGPVNKSYDLFGDGSVQLINIPGHADGLFAVKIVGADGKYVLLYSDGGYARRSWEEMITSGISLDKKLQKQSLLWIREQSLDDNCIESLANHDPNVIPHNILL
ncbi:MBL fold metallo-hydrolase [Anaerosporobacter sp.]